MATTPDYEAAILTLLATLFPSDVVASPVDDRTAMAGPVRPSTDVGVAMIFVQASGGAGDITNDGPMLRVGVSVNVRGNRREYDATRARALRIHDALHMCGRRVVGGVVIVDIRSMHAIPLYLGPGDDDAEFFSDTFDVFTEVLS